MTTTFKPRYHTIDGCRKSFKANGVTALLRVVALEAKQAAAIKCRDAGFAASRSEVDSLAASLTASIVARVVEEHKSQAGLSVHTLLSSQPISITMDWSRVEIDLDAVRAARVKAEDSFYDGAPTPIMPPGVTPLPGEAAERAPAPVASEAVAPLPTASDGFIRMKASELQGILAAAISAAVRDDVRRELQAGSTLEVDSQTVPTPGQPGRSTQRITTRRIAGK